MRIHRTIGVLVIATAALLDAFHQDSDAQEGAAMQALLRPYLDDAYTPSEGPDTDKAFIREYTERIVGALPDKLAVEPTKKRRVLVVTQKTMGALHVPGAAGLLILLRNSAEKYNAFELTEVTTDKAITAEVLSTYDTVVLNNQSVPGNPQFHNRLLPEYVRGGGGLFAVHAAALINSKGETDTEFNRLLGGYVDRSAKYGHPEQHTSVFPVRLPNPNHPLVRAFDGDNRQYQLTHRTLFGKTRTKYSVSMTTPSELCDELYVLLTAADQVYRPTILVEIDAVNSRVVYPEPLNELSHAVTWIKPYGKGRVYYTQLGHNMAVYSVATVAAAMLDGLQYAAGDLRATETEQ